MSIKVSAWVWSTTQDNPVDRLVLLAIADCADDSGGNAFPSMTTLARKACITRKGAQIAIGRLRKSGLIEVKVGGGKSRCNLYTIIMDSVGSSLLEPSDSEQDTQNDVRSEPDSAYDVPETANGVRGGGVPDDQGGAYGGTHRTSLEPSFKHPELAPSATTRPIGEPSTPPYFDKFTPDRVVPASPEVRDAAIAESRRIILDQQRAKANRASG